MSVESTPGAYAPRSQRLPVLLAAVNRRMVHVAGAVADGLIAHPIVDGAALRAAVRGNEWSAAVAAVPTEMVDRLAAAGPAALVRNRVAERLRSGACDTLILHTPSMLMARPEDAATGPGDPARAYREHARRLMAACAPAAPPC